METTSGASLSLYLLEAMVPNYHALVLTDSSLPRWTEDGQSSWFSSVRNLTGIRLAYSRLPALHVWFSGLYLSACSLRLRLLPTCPLWMHQIHLLSILTSFIPYTSL